MPIRGRSVAVAGFLAAGIALDVAILADLEQGEAAANGAGIAEIVWRFERFLFLSLGRFGFFFGELFCPFAVENADLNVHRIDRNRRRGVADKGVFMTFFTVEQMAETLFSNNQHKEDK